MSAPPRSLPSLALSPGRPGPLGARPDEAGVNFAVVSGEADAVDLCLFSADGAQETARIPLRERDGDIWHIHVAGLAPGALYGYRAHGAWRPQEGLRFNAAKLLLDPHARALRGAFAAADALMGHRAGGPQADLERDPRDSAAFVPKAVVPALAQDAPPFRRPAHDPGLRVHYEAHVKGLTALHPGVPAALRGTFAGLAAAPVLEHLTRLGITTIQLLPVQAARSESFLAARGLTNYWGYNTIGFLAPDPRFLSGGEIGEVRDTVRRLHAAGIEVLLDVVYNHTAEGDETGPTLSLRGLDNRAYYKLREGGRFYVNETGCGNTLDLARPAALRLVMDSLRYWRQEMGVDGFRFDLAASLARGPQGFDPHGPFLAALRQDPVLREARLVAEPWDLGPEGYRLGAFPHPFLELNDRYRDDVRRFWRGEPGRAGPLARRLTASAERFDHDGRPATASVNFLASHDGFTLHDLVSYARKHNGANGEDNRDGHEPNHSDNFGVEGPSADPAILAARGRRKRAMLATLFLSQGTPMLLAGDETGNSQGGNNNAYAQDNAVAWIDHAAPDAELAAFVARLARLRRAHPALRQRAFLHGGRGADGQPDLQWRRADGAAPAPQDWADPDLRLVCAQIRMAAGAPGGAAALVLVLNAGGPAEVTLPPGRWRLDLDSAAPQAPEAEVSGRIAVGAQTVLLLAEMPAAPQTRP